MLTGRLSEFKVLDPPVTGREDKDEVDDADDKVAGEDGDGGGVDEA